MDNEIKKAVITGGSGGVGLALIKKLLSENIEILLFMRKTSRRFNRLPKDDRLHVECYALDELQQYIPTEHDYDVFFHLGWANSIKTKRDDIAGQTDNIKYACDAVDLAVQLGCHTFIGVGSQAEYGRKNEPLRPDMLCEPETAYGIVKLSTCYATRTVCEKYGIRHIWTRVLSGYGKYDNECSVLIANIVNSIKKRPLEFSKGEQIWDFVYMEDIANALYLLAKKEKSKGIYLIGSGEARPLKEYLRIMCKKLGEDADAALGKVPYGENQIMHMEADISKLKKDTGWIPQVTFEDGIQRVIEFYKKSDIYL